MLYFLKKHKIDVVLDGSSSKGIGVFSGFLFGIPTIVELLDSPIKIFEYMACGKPVVASDLEIIRDIINENRCGLLAKSGRRFCREDKGTVGG